MLHGIITTTVSDHENLHFAQKKIFDTGWQQKWLKPFSTILDESQFHQNIMRTYPKEEYNHPMPYIQIS